MRAAISTENKLSVLSVMGGAVIWSKQTPSYAGEPFFSPDSQILACNDNGHIQLFDAGSGDAKKMLDVGAQEDHTDYAAISPQGDHIAVVFRSHIGIFRIEDGAMTWKSNKPYISRVCYLSDGRLLYGSGQLVNGQTGGALDGFKFDEAILRGSNRVLCVSVSPDNSLLAVGFWNPSSILICTGWSGELVSRLEGHKTGIYSTSFSSDGTLLVSGSGDQTVRVWQCCPETLTWRCIAVLYGHTETVLTVAFLPGSKRVISVGEFTTIRIWDISAVLQGKEFEVHPKEGAHLVAAWFHQGICLGGWRWGEPFLFQYPFDLPEGVQPLEWHIESEQQDGGDE
jgi:WD40 repeat protein